MIDLEYSFADDRLQILKENTVDNTLCAARFLTLMEDWEEWELEDILDALRQGKIALDIEKLPKSANLGQSAARLQLEAKAESLADLQTQLEENDPLKLYLQEVSLFSGDAPDPNTPMDVQVEAMLGQAVALALQYVGKGVLLLDLIQEANLGLWEAVQNYEGGDYLEHCNWWMQQHLNGVVTLQARQNGVGQMLRQAMEDYRAVDEKLLVDLGRNPTREEIAQAMHMDVEAAQTVASMLENARVLQRVKSPEPEQLPQEEDQAVEDTAYFQMRQRISELLCRLDETSAKLLTMRYGLEGGLPMDAAEVARKLGMTQQEVVDMEAAALAKLRQ